MNLENLFKVIFTLSIEASVLVIFILLVKILFRKKLSPAFHYYIWLLLVIKLILPFGIQSNINIYSPLLKLQNLIINKESSFSKQLLVMGSDIKFLSAAATRDSQQETPKLNQSSTSIDKGINFNKLLGYIWIIGVLTIAVIIAGGIFNIKRIKSKSNRVLILDDLLEECCELVSLSRDIRVVHTDKVSNVSVTGVLRPVILLPSHVITDLSSDKLKLVLLHELIHIKRKDILINYFCLILGCIYWFNPIVIYGFYKLKHYCEISCDAYVISLIGDDEKVRYGSTIIELAEANNYKNLIICTSLMFIRKSDLRGRIVMIKEYKKVGKNSIITSICIIAIVGLLGLSNSSQGNTGIIDKLHSIRYLIEGQDKAKNIEKMKKEKLNINNKYEFYNKIESTINEEIIKNFKFDTKIYSLVTPNDAAAFNAGRFGNFNDYSFCQKVAREISCAVSFPIGSSKNILLISNNMKEAYFAYKDPEGLDIAKRFELNQEEWEERGTLMVQGPKVQDIEYQELKKIH